MDTPPTSPTLVSKRPVPQPSGQCLAGDLKRWSEECPKSPCSVEEDAGRDGSAEELLRLVVSADLDLMAEASGRLSAVPVGRGAYSYVYEILGREKVVKFARSKRQSKSALVEARVHHRIASKCCHVVPIEGITYVGRSQFARLRRGENVPGIVMPKLRMDLQSFYRTQEFGPRAWWKAAVQMLECLQSLKRESYIHGDIKTANILIDCESEPNFYLADFSTAKKVPPHSGAVRGQSVETTMEYCAPETLRDSIESFDTDLYALGLSLLALITRQEPFRELQHAKNHGNYSVQQSQWLMNAVLKNDPINLNVLNESLHRQWAQELSFLSLLLVQRRPVEDCLAAISQFRH